jgi:hypothetical protein
MERLTGSVVVDAAHPRDGKALVCHASIDHVDADGGSVVIVVAGITMLPFGVQPARGVLVLPEQNGNNRPGSRQHRRVDHLRRAPSKLGTLRGLKSPFRSGHRRQHVSVVHRPVFLFSIISIGFTAYTVHLRRT